VRHASGAIARSAAAGRGDEARSAGISIPGIIGRLPSSSGPGGEGNPTPRHDIGAGGSIAESRDEVKPTVQGRFTRTDPYEIGGRTPATATPRLAGPIPSSPNGPQHLEVN